MHVGIEEPVPTLLRRRLRDVTFEHAVGERRRVFPPRLHLARPDRAEVTFEVDPTEDIDAALRVDLAAALLRRVRRTPATPVLAWLTRRGGLEVQDVDLAWLGAIRTAAAEEAAGDVAFVVVNRRAWRDPATGVERTWKRLRRR